MQDANVSDDLWQLSVGKVKALEYGTSTDLFPIMVLLNFYLHVLIHYYFTALFDIFYRYFCLQGISASRHWQEAFIEALNDAGQQEMDRAWPKDGAAQQEAPEEPEDVATQQEASEGPEVKDEADDQPQVTYRLDQF
jgi:hypothetical protein